MNSPELAVEKKALLLLFDLEKGVRVEAMMRARCCGGLKDTPGLTGGASIDVWLPWRDYAETASYARSAIELSSF
jgi:hypothetical protein